MLYPYGIIQLPTVITFILPTYIFLFSAFYNKLTGMRTIFSLNAKESRTKNEIGILSTNIKMFIYYARRPALFLDEKKS
jgi:hypothetical protein